MIHLTCPTDPKIILWLYGLFYAVKDRFLGVRTNVWNVRECHTGSSFSPLVSTNLNMYAVRWLETMTLRFPLVVPCGHPKACVEPICSAFTSHVSGVAEVYFIKHVKTVLQVDNMLNCTLRQDFVAFKASSSRPLFIHCEVYHRGTNHSTRMFETNALQYVYLQHYS